MSNAVLDKEVVQELLAFYQNQKFDELNCKITSLLNEGLSHHILYNLLGASYINLNDLDKAKDCFIEMISKYPNNADGFVNLGSVYHKLNDYKESEEQYLKAINIKGATDETLHNAHNNYGALLLDMKKFDQAIENLKKAIDLDNNSAEPYNNIGNAYREQENYKEALIYYEKAIEKFSNEQKKLGGYTEVLHELEVSYRAIGDHKKGDEYRNDGPGSFLLNDSHDNHVNNNSFTNEDLDIKKFHSFMSCWNINNEKLTDDVINFFELSNKKELGKAGANVNENVKKTVDVTIRPSDLNNPNYKVFDDFLLILNSLFSDYKSDWEILSDLNLSISSFNIQKYEQGGHYQKVHTERMSLGSMHRVFAWMIYLNDVEDGGCTYFPHFDLRIKPEKGKLLIWPAEWTHAHCGELVNSGHKYIMTGWIDMY